MFVTASHRSISLQILIMQRSQAISYNVVRLVQEVCEMVCLQEVSISRPACRNYDRSDWKLRIAWGVDLCYSIGRMEVSIWPRAGQIAPTLVIWPADLVQWNLNLMVLQSPSRMIEPQPHPAEDSRAEQTVPFMSWTWLFYLSSYYIFFFNFPISSIAFVI